ncbi:hypothetical protein AQUCO_01300650v1, partial [Aquilegia coerulea]
LIAITWWNLMKKNSRKEIAPLPPGPWGLPLIGYLPFLDPELHSCFAQLSLKYGPIMKVYLGSKLCIIFSSPDVAKEVLKEQDVNFADRDIPAAAFVSAYGAVDIAFAPYGEHWRMMRKVCVRELLSYGRLEALYGLRRREVRDMVQRVYIKIGSSIDIGEYAFLAMFNVITSMMWGNTLDGEERRRVTSKFREGKERRMKEVVKYFDQIFDFVINERRKMETQEEDEALKSKDKENKDFLQVLLQLIDQGDQKTSITITHLKALFVNMTVGGTKTTSTTVEWAMTELLKQPEIMQKAREELDQVVGLNNVVEENHLSKLPYLDAIVKEVFRLHPVGPLLIPRRARESCIVGGYLIPKGAVIFVNTYAIQRDSKYWTDPLEFRPERFLNPNVKWDYNGNDVRYLPFGSGRRICVGIPIAEKVAPYLLASLLHSFDWKLPEGTKLDLSDQFGFELKKKTPLFAVPTPRLLHSTLYNH